MSILPQNIRLKIPFHPGKRYFIIGDIHGRMFQLQRLLSKVNFSSNDVLIGVGDLIDRGTRSVDVVDFFVNTPNAYTVRGNHEEMFMHACDLDKTHKLREFWIRYGGETTEDNLVKTTRSEQSLKDALINLPFFIDIGNPNDEYCCRVIHADPPLNMNEQDWNNLSRTPNHKILQELLWSRKLHTTYNVIDDGEKFVAFIATRLSREIFCGHTPSGGSIIQHGKVTWVDTGSEYLSMINAVTKETYTVKGLGYYE